MLAAVREKIEKLAPPFLALLLLESYRRSPGLEALLQCSDRH